MLKLYTTSLLDYTPWSGAKDTYQRIKDENMLTDLEYILSDIYPEGLSFTELNDLLWFDGDTVCEWLGIDTDE